MKTHTSQFKNTIKEFCRELDSKITYEQDGVTVELGSEELNSITPHYEGAILKSVMKQLDIDSNVEIPIGTILRYQFGVKVGNEYEYINYGNYVVYKAEKQEDTRSWQITCYDKMLYAMKDYENSNITFPITIKDYLEAICEKVNLEYEGSQFANSDKVIDNELYLDNEGRSLDYTFRDVLDEIAQVSGGTICINNDDELEVRYIKDVGELVNATGGSLTIETDSEVALDNFELEGKTTQANTPTPDNPSELVSVGYENLFDKSKQTYPNGATKTELDTGIKATQTIAGTYKYCYMLFGSDDLLGKTISISCDINSSSNNIGGYAIFFGNTSTVAVSRIGSIISASGLNTITIPSTYPSNTDRIYLLFYSNLSGTGNINDYADFTNFQIAIGNQQHSYIPYGKYGIEVKTNGKNLLDFDAMLNNATATYTKENGIYTITNFSQLYSKQYVINLKPNTTYTISQTYQAQSSTNLRLEILKDGSVIALSFATDQNRIKATFTTSSSGSYTMRLNYGSITTPVIINQPILEEGTQATSYEPYQGHTNLITLDNPLRSIGDTKDLLYIKNGMLYVDRKIGSVVLDGSESWNANQALSNNRYQYYVSFDAKNYSPALSNYFNNSYQNIDNGFYINSSGNTLVVTAPKYNNSYIEGKTNWTTWLSTHNTEVQYVLAEPYTEELGQVNMPNTYKGITYLNTTDELEPNMNITYVSEIETIDEEYLKDVNVNFGEKFGAVNTIVLSRGGDGDKIALSNPTDLADEDKISIQITDNQIMNGNNRANFMQPILSQLYGLEYYINDFSSTGICYLDLCDKYNIKIGDNTYKCIMFNDEVNITQGLEEVIYTDMQEENEQEYKYIGSTDRGITQANIIAKKNEATINAFTQQLDSTNNRLNSVETKQTATDATINVMSTHIDDNGNITEVTTTTGFTFNAEGMTINDSSTNFSALHRNTGTYYYDGDTIVGQYTKDGSKQKDLALFGVYYYGMNDKDDTPMFVAQLYTDENGEECMGHFYNRGD